MVCNRGAGMGKEEYRKGGREEQGDGIKDVMCREKRVCVL